MTWKVRPESGLDSDTCGTLAGPRLGEDTAGSWRARGRLRLGTERRVCVAGVLMAPCLGGELPMRTLCGACTAGVAAPPPALRASGDHLVGSGLGGRSRDEVAPPSRAPPSSPPGPRARDSEASDAAVSDSAVSRRISAVAGELIPSPRSPVRREFGLRRAVGFRVVVYV